MPTSSLQPPLLSPFTRQLPIKHQVLNSCQFLPWWILVVIIVVLLLVLAFVTLYKVRSMTAPSRAPTPARAPEPEPALQMAEELVVEETSFPPPLSLSSSPSHPFPLSFREGR
ncbi:hypothetical protein VNO80_05665 [Phaseolus coccineus]|uniref:Uncharacterized protein n=1 Tax=Phaseolus coccineus TaxID=3886 RepID=A0AAN9RDW1_PHACN